MEKLSISFGRRTYPDTVTAVWGARLIWPNDLVWDRQDMVGDETSEKELAAWLNGRDGALIKALVTLGGRTHYSTGANKLWPKGQGSEDEAVIYQDEHGKIVGSPQGSFGYIYVCAWMYKHVGPGPEPQEVPAW